MSPKRRRKHRVAYRETAEPHEAALSPAERMAAFKDAMRIERSQREAYVHTLGFSPDPFQIRAMDAVERGECVLVAAPTGAGKTIVGEFAAYRAHIRGRRCFYTTPIKALSNQKYRDLSKRFGHENVGLLTGDTSMNPDAPILVMTTEVLRNMIYAGTDLGDLDAVVLDEVHYLSDRLRGPVWEEVIIHLPLSSQIVALSATVSNAEEFGRWIAQVRGGCEVVVSEVRPVPLYQHMMLGRTLYDLYAPGSDPCGEVRINPELRAALSPQASMRPGRQGRNWHVSHSRRVPRESRASTLITLERENLLPAITFVFSRAGCESAVSQVLGAGIVLTTPAQAATIREFVDETITKIAPEDFDVLGVASWANGLERGVAAHHAGMLPLMKETVERLFTMGLIKMVYATETLALGINMPARSVVIESLTKWNGQAHQRITPGEYTQLSGRAGRRGIDTQGHAVVLHRGTVQPEELASLSSKRTYPLVSAFGPTYNMVVNLLDHSTRALTREVLETSFAQFQADGAVVRLAQRAKELVSRRDALEDSMRCDRGDSQEYFRLRDELSLAQKHQAKVRGVQRRQATRDVLSSLSAGDIIAYGKGRRTLYAVVARREETSIGTAAIVVIGTDGKFHTLTHAESSRGLRRVGHLMIPGGSALRRNKERVRICEELRGRLRSGTLDVPRAQEVPPERGAIEHLESAVRSHPVHRCPERDIHARAGYEWARLNRELGTVVAQVDARTNSVAKRFDKVCAVLEELGFLHGDHVTHRGQRLRRVFGERDLVVMEALAQGAWDGLGDAEFAAIASSCVFESRQDEPSALSPGIPHALSVAWDKTQEAFQRVRRAERGAGLEPSPAPDPGLVGACLAWAHGAALSTAVANTELAAGDFVRWIRQLVDLLDQLRNLDDPVLAERARRARNLLIRGVVAWQSL